MSADLAFPGDPGFAAAVARARRDMAGKLQRRAALTSQLACATSDAERRALLSLAECTQTQEMLDKTRPRIALAEFEPLAVLGRGGFGEVSLVRRAGALYAMKRIPRDAAHSLAHILNERNALVLTSAPLLPWVTTLHFSFQTDSDLFFVTDWACGGDLMQMRACPQRQHPRPRARALLAPLTRSARARAPPSPPFSHCQGRAARAPGAPVRS
jgi:serine/threonine protein kinase